ncbi:FAD binding domain-containing protein [Suillus subalutaceus]|uniref:FAD binding domain-containing protein n=1 Tax=Suillus subalutaceus TaxID=48586 RepID=UPI001B8763FB|nr:FAD binding domain-containing protein [Suillus subalutaceus]KAG1848326.1 FAD binding domain-containing protein [Suillus subalutaceus]
MPAPFVRHSEVDVLIIGAGPAGLMCANALANARVDVRIVDQRASKVTTGRGDGISPRTTELLQSYGLAERFLRESCQLHLAAFYNPSSTGGIEFTNRTSDVTAPSVRYPFELALNQGAIQDIFLDSMTPLGVELSKDENELTDPTSYPVRVDEPQEEIVHAKFVVGGDGAHSWIRKQFDVTMDGEQSDSIWGVVDMVAPDTDFPDIRNKTLIRSNHGSVFVIPREQDRTRIYVQLEDKDFINPVTGRPDKEKVGPEQILETAQKSLEPYKLIRKSEFVWWTIYSVGQRVASQFSIKNRVFIAGDACHTHSPKAGQGMNAAINDSHNLGMSSFPVVRGWADMALLSTYESERRKFALDLIAWDKTPLTEQNSDGVSPEHVLKTFQTDFTSGVGIHYQPSIAHGLVLGKRVPPYKFMRAADACPFELQDLLPSDFLFKLLVFTWVESMVTDMQKPESFLKRYSTPGNSRFDIITISKGRKETFNFLRTPLRFFALIGQTSGEKVTQYYGVGPEGALVAVRPDGYVGAIAPLDRVGGLDAYFASFMKITAQA